MSRKHPLVLLQFSQVISWFYSGWWELLRVFVLAILAYSALLVCLRVSGKRSLTRMNVFDFVCVVALGSTLATTILTRGVTLSAAVVTVATLLGLQIGLSWLTTRSSWIERFVNGEPTLLLHSGNFLHHAMQRERVTEEEIRAAIRTRGLTSIDAVDSVVLETDGSLSVVWKQLPGTSRSVEDVPGHPAGKSSRQP